MAVESPARIKWQKHRGRICLRFLALASCLAAVISFAYSQVHHDAGQLLVSDLGHHQVTEATATVRSFQGPPEIY